MVKTKEDMTSLTSKPMSQQKRSLWDRVKDPLQISEFLFANDGLRYS